MKKIIRSNIFILVFLIFPCMYSGNQIAKEKIKKLSVEKIPLAVTNTFQFHQKKNAIIRSATKYIYTYPPEAKYLFLILNDTTFAFCTDTHSIIICDIEKGNYIQVLRGHKANITCLAVLSEKLIMSGAEDGKIKIWDWKAGVCEKTLNGCKTSISCLIPLPQSRIAAGTVNGFIKIFDFETGKNKAIKAYENKSIKRLLCVEESCGSILFSCSTDDEIKSFSGKTGMAVTKKIETKQDSILMQSLKGGLRYFPDWKIFLYSSGYGILRFRQDKKGKNEQTVTMESVKEGENYYYDGIGDVLLNKDLGKIIIATRFGFIIVMSIDTDDLVLYFKNMREIMPGKKKKPHFEDLGINFN